MFNFISGICAIIILIVGFLIGFFLISLIVYIGTRGVFYFLIDAFLDAKEKVLSDRFENEKNGNKFIK